MFIKLSYGADPYTINIEARRAGEDIIASVTGGTRPHVGAVALAEPAAAQHPVTGATYQEDYQGDGTFDRHGISKVPSPGNVSEVPSPCNVSPCIVNVIAAAGHKDELIAEMFAKRLCEKYGVNICVSAGAHVDDASIEEIALLVDNAKNLLKLI